MSIWDSSEMLMIFFKKIINWGNLDKHGHLVCDIVNNKFIHYY